MAPSTNLEARLRSPLQPISLVKTSATQAFFVFVLLFCIFSISYSIKRYRKSHKQKSVSYNRPADDHEKLSNVKVILKNQQRNPSRTDNMSVFWGPLPSTGLGYEPFRPIHSGVIAARIAEEEERKKLMSFISNIGPSGFDQENTSRPCDSYLPSSLPTFNTNNEDEKVHTMPSSRFVKNKDKVDYIPDSSHQPMGYWRRRTVEFHSIPTQ